MRRHIEKAKVSVASLSILSFMVTLINQPILLTRCVNRILRR